MSKVTTSRKVAALSDKDITRTAAALSKAGVTVDTVAAVVADEATVAGAAEAKARLEANRRNVWKFAAVTCGGKAPANGKATGVVAEGLATLYAAMGGDTPAVRKMVARYRWAGLLSVAFPTISDARIGALSVDAKAAREAFMSGVFPAEGTRKPRPAADKGKGDDKGKGGKPADDAAKVAAAIASKSREAADKLTTTGKDLAAVALTDSILKDSNVTPQQIAGRVENALRVLDKYAPAAAAAARAAIAEAAA